MMRLAISIFCMMFFINISRICDLFFPEYDDESTKNWDKLKHSLYIVCIGMTWLLHYFKPDERYEKYVTLVVSVFVFGVIIPSIIDKRNSYEPQKWYDFAFILLSFYLGSKDIFPKFHKWYKLCWKRK